MRKPEGKRPLGRPKHRYKNNIKVDHKKSDGAMDQIVLSQDRESWQALVIAVMQLRFLHNAENSVTG
jgi:hypothetical protein